MNAGEREKGSLTGLRTVSKTSWEVVRQRLRIPRFGTTQEKETRREVLVNGNSDSTLLKRCRLTEMSKAGVRRRGLAYDGKGGDPSKEGEECELKEEWDEKERW